VIVVVDVTVVDVGCSLVRVTVVGYRAIVIVVALLLLFAVVERCCCCCIVTVILLDVPVGVRRYSGILFNYAG